MGGKVVFKEYDPAKLTFLPYELEKLVQAGQGHSVFFAPLINTPFLTSSLIPV